MVWIGIALGVLLGIFQAKKRGGKPLDMAQYGAAYGIALGVVALIINIVIMRMGAG